jgi:hypothetical protein
MAVWWEATGSPTEDFSDRGINLQMIVRCDWADRYTVAAYFLTSEPGGVVYPHNLALAARARRAAIKPAEGLLGNDGTGLAVYEHAEVTVVFNIGQGPETQNLISESLEPTVEFLTQDYRKFRWDSGSGDPIQEEEAPGKLVRGLKYVITLYDRTSIPGDCIDLPGSVNQDQVTAQLLGMTFPAQTLLFEGCNLQRKFKTDGTGLWNVTLSFAYRTSGWNQFWRAATSQYESLYLASDGSAWDSYPPASFDNLLP